MRSRFPVVLLAAAAAAALGLVACAGDPPTMPQTPPAPVQDAARRTALARQFAVALADPGFRREVRAALVASPVREHKLHLQRWFRGAPSRLQAFAGLTARPLEATDAELLAAPELEVYFPVDGDLERWSGGPDLLVATAEQDHEAPLAFDVRGQSRTLSAEAPPTEPVLAVVPVETDFDAPASLTEDDGGAGTPLPSTAGLYLTRAQFVQSFEGWLKGDPEFDIHVLARSGGKDSLSAISCTGRAAAGAYFYNQASLTWSGSALLMTADQIDLYRQQHGGEGVRLFVVEDDDGACRMKVNADTYGTMAQTIEARWPEVTAGISPNAKLTQRFEATRAITRIVRAVAGFFKTNDDIVGNAVERVVTGEAAPFGNWVVKGEGAATTGWLQLEMR